MTATPSDKLRQRWLDALLPEVAFDGWTEAAAARAAKAAGLDQGEQALAAPRGVQDLIDAFFDRAGQVAKESLAAQDLAAMGVTARVTAGVLAWLEALQPHREAVRRATTRGLLPWHAGPAMQRAWQVADMVWDAAGDTAKDYNRYSKRGLLAAALPPIVLYWLDAPSDEDLDAYVTRRLAQASGIGRSAGKIVGPLLDAVSAGVPNGRSR
ncbi:MAG: COQ9 family protein [Hyphomonas sp.]|uniref:COQ9 family protein n=1 Tax=Hyphomonas sp. TaxID=87 RepID=UPI003527A429